MSRISIEVTPEEHEKLKNLAELRGKSIEEFVLERTLAATVYPAEDKALLELEAVLDDRIRRAKAGEVSNQTSSARSQGDRSLYGFQVGNRAVQTISGILGSLFSGNQPKRDQAKNSPQVKSRPDVHPLRASLCFLPREER